MITPELINYIKTELASGQSREAITQGLQTQGWSPSDLNEAFDSIPSAPPIPTNPVPTASPLASSYVAPSVATASSGLSLTWIVAIIVLVLGLIGGGAYYFVSKNGQISTNGIQVYDQTNLDTTNNNLLNSNNTDTNIVTENNPITDIVAGKNCSDFFPYNVIDQEFPLIKFKENGNSSSKDVHGYTFLKCNYEAGSVDDDYKLKFYLAGLVVYANTISDISNLSTEENLKSFNTKDASCAPSSIGSKSLTCSGGILSPEGHNLGLISFITSNKKYYIQASITAPVETSKVLKVAENLAKAVDSKLK